MFFEKISARIPFNTIGVRLTLWGTAITLAVCLLFLGVLYVGTYLSLHRQVDGFLEGEVNELKTMLAEHPRNYVRAQADIRREIGSRTRRDLFFRVLDANGSTKVTSEERDPLPSPW